MYLTLAWSQAFATFAQSALMNIKIIIRRRRIKRGRRRRRKKR